MFTTKSFLLKTTVLTAFMTLAFAAQGQQLNLKIGHDQAVGSPYDLTAHRFADNVSKLSNGRIKVDVFPQAQIGDEVKMIQNARLGSADLVISSQAVLSATVKPFSIFDIPELFDSWEQTNQILHGPIGRKYLDVLPKYGLYGLGFLYGIERDFATTKPIRNAADFKGMKLRVIQSPGYVATYKALGAQPTPMPYGDVYLAMQQGVVDGGAFSPESVTLDKFTEVAKYFNLTQIHFLPSLMTYSKKRWDALKPEDREIIQKAADETFKDAPGFYRQTYDTAMEGIKKSGMTIIDTDRKSIREALVGVQQEMLKSVPDGAERFKEIQDAKAKL